MSYKVSRRQALSGVAATAVLAASPLITSCRTSGDTEDQVDGGRAEAAMPAYVPFDLIKTDYPATAAGGLAAFLGLARPAPETISEVPGRGGTVTALFETEIPVGPPLAQNVSWQNLNAALGVDLQMQQVQSDQYMAKIATTLAGNDLPDIMSIPYNGLPQMPRLLESQFTDLSEYLAGDAVKDYPMLALRPESMWRNTIYNKKIYGVPTPNSRLGGVMVARKDILDSHGLTSEVGSAEEFAELCLALTDKASGKYADGRPMSTFTFVKEMFGVPNAWRVENGAFTSEYESEEFKQALDYMARLWKQEVFRPDAFYASTEAMIDHWGTGNTALFLWGGTGWQGQLTTYGARDPKMDLAFIHPPKADGGGPAAKRLGPGVYRMGVIRKGQTPDRVRELLRVLNYLAASYGTAEYLTVTYGVEGKSWNWAEADAGLYLPERTEQGQAEANMVFYMSGPLFVLSNPGYPDTTIRSYEYMKAAAEGGEPLPTSGLYSQTDSTKGATWGAEINDLVAAIIQGRSTLRDWESLVARWKTDCGDAIASEYAAAFAAVNG